MTREELIAQTRQLVAAWNAHDAEAVAEYYTADATVRDAPDADNPAEGHDAIAARARMILGGFSDANLEETSICVDGNSVCMEWQFTGTHDGEFAGVPPTGRATRNVGVTVDEVGDDGKIVSETAYWDLSTFLRQVGVLPEAAQASAS
jgi:steroid delta-isomerase-like uncharacterized protein